MHARIVFGLALATSLLTAGMAGAQTPGKQETQSLNKPITRTATAGYLLYLPKDYGKDPNKRWPLLMFLHGAGESGSDLEKVKVHGPPKLIAQGKEFPFIVISPQCPSVREWWDRNTLNALLDEVIAKYRVDEERLYLTGLSMGGYGTWELSTRFPERFAAIAPICGGGRPRFAPRLTGMGIWVGHGAKDPVDVKFTVYPEAQHDSWTETYNNPELYEWFLQHRRAKP
ncbi:MAG: phospholipase [Armatimonadetes bacterium]|nr:phospholipase [Armatimonadota bacterium]